MKEDASRAEFGCERCWPDSAEAAWAARRGLTLESDLIDESHFHVMILACPACSQRFVSVFTERIDWVDGDDPQYWTLLPLTSEEASGLVRQGDSLTEAALNELGRGRKSLRQDHPKGEPSRSYWAAGISAGWHD